MPTPPAHLIAIRASKSVLVLFAALFCLLVGYNNIVDYGSNYTFVQHVMSMDTTFPGNHLKERAITSPFVHHVAYGLIIAGELAAGLLCLVGALNLFRHIWSEQYLFVRAKALAVAGITIGLSVWFFGFLTVAAEWFLMWQSQQWNAVQPAFRFVLCLAVILIYLVQPEAEG
ncbi:DUF2165 family protein [Methylobacterium oxalidis]|uniref:Membrane protein n=1 Tax=Methylobacterium oxalidis TaxID=944322 RepID=A0A512IZB5_9HYPH|nr:DUF2165 domain-containing protein [Methylobacterium oxalidis]GEP03054.1 membrane protein [Methylobacterium oxalidis]GJE31668.1 hypothetical protein LDDCCGHA_1848 [Methylobacterium oxalidis]GLS65987.1 membrane protein [Methylobacterium oxalidis]